MVLKEVPVMSGGGNMSTLWNDIVSVAMTNPVVFNFFVSNQG